MVEGDIDLHRTRQSWASVSYLVLTSAVLAAVLIIGFLLFLKTTQESLTRETFARGDLYGRFMERQISSELDGLESLTETLVPPLFAPSEEEAISLKLNEAFRQRPIVRSVSVLDDLGVIRVSSSLSIVGQMTPLQALPHPPGEDKQLVPGFEPLSGRDLADIRSIQVQTEHQGAAQDLFAFTHLLPGPQGRPYRMVILVNLAYLHNQASLLVRESGTIASLLDLKGVTLVSTDAGVKIGDKVDTVETLLPLIAQRDYDHYQAHRSQGHYSLHSFRVLKNWPWVVVIDTPTSLIERQLMETARPALLLLMSLLVLLFGATLLAVRSLRRHQTVLRRLDAAKSNVVVADVRNRAILNSAMDAILSVDGHGKVVTFNGAAERIFEYPADMAIGKSMHELLSISSLKGGPESLFETLQENDGQKVTRVRRELEAVRRSGEIFPAEISVVPVQIGRDWLLTISIRDITDRKKLERQNGLLLDQYRQSALDLSTHKHALDEHALVSINDPEGTVVYANDKLLAVLDYEREDLIGKKLYNLREPSLSDWDYAQMRRAQVLGDIWHGELAFRDRSGKVLWFSSSIIPVKSTDGLVREFITIQTDITDRKEAEQAIANAQQRELQIGARIQESLLISSTDPRVNGLAVSGFSRSLLGINGDFYEITKVGDDMVDIVAGDVMGKGIPAALLGAATKMQLNRSLVDLLLQNADAKLPEPSEIVSDLNRVIGPHLQSLNAFVTLVYLRIDVKNQRVTWVGCGHEETLCIRADGQHEYLPNQHPPVGVLLDETFEQSCMALSEGDAIFLCSDGVSDALINESDRYGRDRLTGSVVTQFSHKKTATMTLQGLYREVVERITPTDDVMMLMVVREAVQDNHWRMELASNLQSIDAARSLLDKAFSDTRCSETRAGLFKVATVEAITNVIRHGLGEVQDAKLEMIVVKSDDRLTVDLLYLGDAFMPSGDLNEIDLSSYPEGGFGLFIMRQACDELIFSHSQEVNRTRLVCHLIDDSLH